MVEHEGSSFGPSHLSPPCLAGFFSLRVFFPLPHFVIFPSTSTWSSYWQSPQSPHWQCSIGIWMIKSCLDVWYYYYPNHRSIFQSMNYLGRVQHILLLTIRRNFLQVQVVCRDGESSPLLQLKVLDRPHCTCPWFQRTQLSCCRLHEVQDSHRAFEPRDPIHSRLCTTRKCYCWCRLSKYNAIK